MNISLEPILPTSPRNRHLLLRLLAGFLAAIATLWAIFLAILVLPDWPQAILWFGPGYLLTAAYYWRALGHPSLNWARAIWILSLLTQGTWLICFLVSASHGHVQGDPFDILILIWWTISTLISFIALFLEPSY
ncbi:MAG TPA: hypothetical protein VHS31_09435 [Tepidisphaeraceae bacterium]|jgi:hypothetical protein|nr:hypothetical protein [Tepidisphaeraceae bacterium]